MISHPPGPGGHDDLAVVCCGAALLAVAPASQEMGMLNMFTGEVVPLSKWHARHWAASLGLDPTPGDPMLWNTTTRTR